MIDMEITRIVDMEITRITIILMGENFIHNRR